MTAKQKTWLYIGLDLFASYVVPFLAIVYHYDLFGGTITSERMRSVGWIYVFVIAIVGGLLWRVRMIIKLSGKKGWQFALTKSTLPLIEILMYFMLGAADGHILRLQNILIVWAISHTTAIYFRYQAGKQYE